MDRACAGFHVEDSEAMFYVEVKRAVFARQDAKKPLLREQGLSENGRDQEPNVYSRMYFAPLRVMSLTSTTRPSVSAA